MRLGINLGYWGAGMDGDNLAVAKEADRLGYDVCWAAEAYGSDAPTVLSWVAAQTERIDVGSAIMQIPARQPAMTAMTAATLDSLSGGRFRLGLGVSGPQVSEGWYGVKFDKPLSRTREYVEIVRKAMSRERLSYEGEHWTLPLPGRPGQADQAHRAPGARAHPALHRRDRPQEPGADRRDRRRRAADLPVRRAPRGHRAQAPAGGPREGRARRMDGFDVCPTLPLAVGDDVTRPGRHVPSVHRAVRRRHGQPQAELLQPACAAHGLREGSRRDPGQVPVRRQGRARPPPSRTS